MDFYFCKKQHLMKNVLLLFAFLISGFIHANNITIDSLKEQIAAANNSENYDFSIQLLSTFLSDKNVSASDKYQAYLIKANIYRKLFKYEHALHHLDLALEEGIKGSNIFTVQQEIKAERSFIYFDKQEFDKAEKLLKELEKTAYHSLNPKYLLFLYTQKGYFLLKDQKYEASEKILNEALKIAMLHFPTESPIVYGKQIELYNLIKDTVKRDQAYHSGIEAAQKANNLKYEFYLHEIMKNVFSSNNDYKNAFYHQKKCDSVFSLYNSNIKSSRIELLEQQLKEQQYEYELNHKQNFLFWLILFSVVLMLVVFLLIKLYMNSKEKQLLMEEENQRIHEEIRYHVKLAKTAGERKTNLSSFNLTERQLAIIELVQKGKSNKEIAAELFISSNTVKYHLKTIYTLLNIKQRNELLILYSS